PVWMQSVEKYADRQVQELLRQVAAGNDPGNFVFVLNKVDQLGEETGRRRDGEKKWGSDEATKRRSDGGGEGRGDDTVTRGQGDKVKSAAEPLTPSPPHPLALSSSSAIEELREDFGRRIANVLRL